jgi:hypothetical protein
VALSSPTATLLYVLVDSSRSASRDAGMPYRFASFRLASSFHLAFWPPSVLFWIWEDAEVVSADL